MAEKEPSGILIARQPLLDAQKRIHGYELMYHAPIWKQVDPEESTRYVLNCLEHHFSPEVLAAGRVVFVNVTPRVLLEGSYAHLPAEHTVIELLMPGQAVDSALIDACRAVRAAGFRLSLDGFDPASPAAAPLAEIADYLKFDLSTGSVGGDFKAMRSFARPARTVVAYPVNTAEQFQAGCAAGIDLFQGFFFFKPQLLQHRDIPAFKMNYIRFLEAVSRPEIEIKDLEKIIRQDASISVALLRLINSAAFGLRSEVKSIRQALAMLGETKVRRWAASLAARELGSGKPPEIIGITLVRAFFCEALGKLLRLESHLLDLFMTGIISGLPAMLDVPLLKLLDELSIGEAIRDALASKPTPMGNLFSLALAHETGAFTSLSRMIQDLRINLNALSSAFYDATREVNAITAELGSGAAAA